MKLKLAYIRFSFTDENGNSYDVICPDGVRTKNEFTVFKNANKIGTWSAAGGHVKQNKCKKGFTYGNKKHLEIKIVSLVLRAAFLRCPIFNSLYQCNGVYGLF